MWLFSWMSTPLSLAPLQGPNEKKTKRKMRRDKRKVMKKRLHSADPQDNFMSELPFCVTSPTTWKELGCAWFHHITWLLWLSYHLQRFIPYVLTCSSLQFQRQNQTKRRERESATVEDGWIVRRMQRGRKKRKRTKDPTTSSPSPSLIHRWRIPVLLVGEVVSVRSSSLIKIFFHTQFNLVIGAKLKIQN